MFDPLFRPDATSIPDLVEKLRDIHLGRASKPGSPAVPALSQLVLEGIRRGSEQLSRVLEAVTSNQTPRSYADLQAQVARLERAGAARTEAVDRAFAGRAAIAPYQETLYLQCARGGRAAGRFRCVNRRAQRTTVTTTLRSFTLAGAPVAHAPSVTVRPGRFMLDANAASVVEVELDFASCPALVADKLQTSIDLVMDEAVALKLWIEVEVYD